MKIESNMGIFRIERAKGTPKQQETLVITSSRDSLVKLREAAVNASTSRATEAYFPIRKKAPMPGLTFSVYEMRVHEENIQELQDAFFGPVMIALAAA